MFFCPPDGLFVDFFMQVKFIVRHGPVTQVVE